MVNLARRYLFPLRSGFVQQFPFCFKRIALAALTIRAARANFLRPKFAEHGGVIGVV